MVKEEKTDTRNAEIYATVTMKISPQGSFVEISDEHRLLSGSQKEWLSMKVGAVGLSIANEMFLHKRMQSQQKALNGLTLHFEAIDEDVEMMKRKINAASGNGTKTREIFLVLFILTSLMWLVLFLMVTSPKP